MISQYLVEWIYKLFSYSTIARYLSYSIFLKNNKDKATVNIVLLVGFNSMKLLLKNNSQSEYNILYY